MKIHLLHFLSLSLFFVTLRVLKNTDQSSVFVECALNWLCLMFPHDWSVVIDLGEEYTKVSTLAFASHQACVRSTGYIISEIHSDLLVQVAPAMSHHWTGCHFP